MSLHLPNGTWQQLEAGYAAGIWPKGIARKMNVPEGTVLARAKRKGWTQQIAAAKTGGCFNVINRSSDARAGRTLTRAEAG